MNHTYPTREQVEEAEQEEIRKKLNELAIVEDLINQLVEDEKLYPNPNPHIMVRLLVWVARRLLKEARNE